MAVRIHDGIDLSQRTLIHRPGRRPRRVRRPRRHGPVCALRAQEFLGFAGQTWTVVARSGPAFEQRYANDSARIIAVAGLA